MNTNTLYKVEALDRHLLRLGSLLEGVDHTQGVLYAFAYSTRYTLSVFRGLDNQSDYIKLKQLYALSVMIGGMLYTLDMPNTQLPEKIKKEIYPILGDALDEIGRGITDYKNRIKGTAYSDDNSPSTDRIH